VSSYLNRELCTACAGQMFLADGAEYRLGGKEGDGATGLVYKAMRNNDGQVQAVKFLAPDPKYINPEAFDDVTARFKREGERGPQLSHPHLIDIYSYNENENGRCFTGGSPKNPFVLMEFVRGRTLEDFLRKAQTKRSGFEATQERLHIAIQVACALEYLNKQKLIHRDVKPANIFIGKTNHGGYPLVKLGDFGIVKWGDFHSSLATGTLTATNQQGLGTMKYMSPEQAIHPKDVMVSSDVYSFGITLYELFTGQILTSPHHIMEIILARRGKGNTYSRYHALGYDISMADEDIATAILDTFLVAKSRPKISDLRGRLEFSYERFHTNWRDDLDEKIYYGASVRQ